MKKLAGIDLGTTFSALAVLNDLGKPEIVPDLNNNRIIPSVVAFRSDGGGALVGYSAKQILETHPESVIQFVKRKMDDPSHVYSCNGKNYSPIDISAIILKKLKDECVQDGEVRDVVITVPAHFTEIQRKSTMDAATIAGLNVLGIINEPTAAALFYSTVSSLKGRVVVFDLGGGTFDVTVLRVEEDDIEILASKGDGHLGGVDFDHEIVKHINVEAQHKLGSVLFSEKLLSGRAGAICTEENALYNKALEKAEMAKKTLSVRPTAKINLVTPKGDLSVELTRARFEELISSHLATTEMLVENALEDAGLSPGDVDKVILVGGSTRIPKVPETIERLFGFSPERAVNVDEAVALGAAVEAGRRKVAKEGSGSVSVAVASEVGRICLTERCNKNFGTFAVVTSDTHGREELQNTIILRKNTKLLCRRSEAFFTRYDGQKQVRVRITESEEEESDPDNVTKIGELLLDLPQDCPRGSKITVAYGYDENQRLACEVALPDGRCYETEIGYEGGNLNQSEIRKKQASLKAFIVE